MLRNTRIHAVHICIAIVLYFILSVFIGCGQNAKDDDATCLQFQAHRGVSSEAPENTMAAFALAADQGYNYIELDPAVTKDGVIVILHDDTVTRTARKPSHAASNSSDPAKHPQEVNKLTYTQLTGFDFGAYYSEKFIGEKIPRYEDVLSFAEKRNIAIKLDNKIWRLPPENLETIFKLTEKSKADVAVTCATVEQVQRAESRLNHPIIHYDGNVDTTILEQLDNIVDGELYVWLPYEKIASNSTETDTVVTVKKYAKLGIYTIDTEEQLNKAVEHNADIIETNGRLKPRPIKVRKRGGYRQSQNGLSQTKRPTTDLSYSIL